MPQNPPEGLLKTQRTGSTPRVSVIGTGRWSSPVPSNCEQQRHLVVRRGTNLAFPENLSPGGALGSRTVRAKGSAAQVEASRPSPCPRVCRHLNASFYSRDGETYSCFLELSASFQNTSILIFVNNFFPLSFHPQKAKACEPTP